MSKERILIVEDDPSIFAGLRLNLEMEGYEVLHAADGHTAVQMFTSDLPELVLLDVMLPELNGFEVLEAIRKVDPNAAVLMLSARDGQEDKVLGLELGADDYVPKPFQLAELLARINAALRRSRLKKGGATGTLKFANVTIDTSDRRVLRDGELLEMTTREYDLLVYLVRRPNRVSTRAAILEHVWGDEYEGTARTVDNFIARLRNKVEVNGDQPLHIETVRGVGYRFVPEPAAS